MIPEIKKLKVWLCFRFREEEKNGRNFFQKFESKLQIIEGTATSMKMLGVDQKLGCFCTNQVFMHIDEWFLIFRRQGAPANRTEEKISN